MSYTLYGSVRSRALRVLWLLEELEVPYEHVATGPRSAEVTAIYPAGKVPVLVADGEALTDSTAIMTYLADRHGRFTEKAGTLARARQDGHTQFLLDEMDACIWTAARHSFILPEDRRLPAIKDSLKWEFGGAVDRLTERLGDGPFLMGADMTVPDIIATHCLTWAEVAKFPVENAAAQTYRARMLARPAYARATSR